MPDPADELPASIAALGRVQVARPTDTATAAARLRTTPEGLDAISRLIDTGKPVLPCDLAPVFYDARCAHVLLQRLADADLLADKTPIDADWLRSIGFSCCAHWGAMNIGDHHNSMAVEWDYGKWRLTAQRKSGDMCDFTFAIPPPANRGAVRLLLRGLGIQTTDLRAALESEVGK